MKKILSLLVAVSILLSGSTLVLAGQTCTAKTGSPAACDKAKKGAKHTKHVKKGVKKVDVPAVK